MNKLDRDYLNLINDILENGHISDDRTGTGTKKVFGREIRHNMKDGLPMLTTKKMFSKGVIIELLWFLSGSTNIKKLVDNNVYIWIGDCYKKYKKDFEKIEVDSLFGSIENPMTETEFIDYIKTHEETDPFVNKYADIGKGGYGKMWRNFSGVDQIKVLIKELKNNPDSRRLMVTAWNPKLISETLLPPCHFGFQCFTRKLTLDERYDLYANSISEIHHVRENITHDYLDIYVPSRAISLKWHQRSTDSALGFGFNVLSYGLLLEMIAQQTNMIAEELIGSLGDTHIYLNQIETYEREQKNNIPFELPTLKLKKAKSIFNYKVGDFEIINYKSHNTIRYELSN